MMRASAFGIGTAPGLSYITYSAEKIIWNMVNLNNPLTNLNGEANSNAPHALSYWYYSSDMTLRKLFAESLDICKNHL